MDFTDIALLALKALSERVILLLAMCMSCGLFAWSMYIGTELALGTAAAFALLVFIPVLLRGKHGKAAIQRPEDDSV